MSMTESLKGVAGRTLGGLEFLAPVADLGLRAWVSWVFLRSGINKYESWDTTLMLFEYEYAVPMLSPGAAAYLGTAAELALPVFLILGLGGRFAALGLFAFNIVAVISYPDMNPSGVQQHLLWGLMLLVAVLHGPGKLSIDHFLRRSFIPER